MVSRAELAQALAQGVYQDYAPSKKTVAKGVAAIAALTAIALIAYNFQAIRAFANKQIGHAQQLIGGNHAPNLAGKPIDVRPPTTFGVQNGVWGWHEQG